ncbi:alanyl-tRNA synthetase [Magnetococcus marinus MC-1]|uniref:Alanine--tRNA ligase n=1 Tax=Magnetococcus marinus (strain ATCC BAA-1437 / JCM 17883 / MC-1) TaxID=156889 RepID=SYA_MAGMM|nr:alanine--tRNA ligase [Magnetococcus marinus]A0L3J9.1 RecName: Full=Alanine--tRNA ligase; AltName: Full=Alanyl-tRNA synthetase; Short=AlaRS [Magnetococcus marinus MC-1]ABK42542.1 alanyl-tRNA synthetase [Magnetococcus marinus MC-1]
MNGNEIRKRFVAFFQQHGHTHVESSSLVPRNDPTLLFTNAGMVQFKSLFLGEERRDYSRAVSAQKCVRAGGKHNDLENVGRTARHHTFFEMLGNFSFGDYFKEEAIRLGWRFVTEDLGIDAQRLLVTVYSEDDEAYAIWTQQIGLPADKVIRIPTTDNFWSMGDTGPCGPCSEIFYDYGDTVAGGPPGSEDEDGDRFVEIWNLVFMQYDRSSDGTLTPLPKPSIDTGAGLERLASVLQGKTNNYDTDLFQPLIKAAAALAGVDDTTCSAEQLVSLRVIADHIRSVSFLIADGVLPSNEGRGYVLRRIMRRGMRHGRLLGLEQPFMHKLVETLGALMGDTYPELTAQRKTLAMVIETEEKRFAATLGTGLKHLEEAVAGLRMGDVLDGKTLFTLYDTFGFPLDLTADILRDREIGVDQEGFSACMKEQRERARAAWSGSGEASLGALYHPLLERVGASEFLGYVHESASASVVALIKNGAEVESLTAGDEGSVVCNQTPFYGESGGQVGDRGVIQLANGARFTVTDTQKPLPDLIVHHGKMVTGTVHLGDHAELQVDGATRQAIRLHHSATHLMHHALRAVLGEHVKQAGSHVSAERLRLDFSHFQGMSEEELRAVEDRVNGAILSNVSQETAVMTPQEAVAAGAMALFGEKYGDEVRVVRIGDSMELCGGTHVSRSGDMGIFHILSESAVAAGVRRLEAVCGGRARAIFRGDQEALKAAAALLKTQPNKLAEGIERLLGKQKELEKSLEKLQSAQAGGMVEALLEQAVEVGGIKLLAVEVKGVDGKALREMVDQVKDKLGSGVILLALGGDKVSLVAGVTKDLAGKRVKAGDLMAFAAAMVGGKGGGRPDMAQGGGTEVAAIPTMLTAIPGWLQEQLG